MPLVDIQRVVCNVFIFSEISELLWEGSTIDKALMYSLIISWRSLDGAAGAGEMLLFPYSIKRWNAPSSL